MRSRVQRVQREQANARRDLHELEQRQDPEFSSMKAFNSFVERFSEPMPQQLAKHAMASREHPARRGGSLLDVTGRPSRAMSAGPLGRSAAQGHLHSRSSAHAAAMMQSSIMGGQSLSTHSGTGSGGFRKHGPDSSRRRSAGAANSGRGTATSSPPRSWSLSRGPAASSASVIGARSLPVVRAEGSFVSTALAEDLATELGGGEAANAAAPATTPGPTLVEKIATLELFIAEQKAAIADYRAENLELRHAALVGKRERAQLRNDVERTQLELAECAELRLRRTDMDPEDSPYHAARLAAQKGRRRQTAAEKRQAADFDRRRSMFAKDSVELSRLAPGGEYDPFAEDAVIEGEAGESLGNVLVGVKKFLVEVETEQFVSRKVREEVDSFVHSLGDMGKRSDVVWETQSPNGTWKKMPGRASAQIRKAVQENLPAADVRVSGAKTIRVNFEGMTAVRLEPRELRARERSANERAAAMLAHFSQSKVITASKGTGRGGVGLDGAASGAQGAFADESMQNAPKAYQVFKDIGDKLEVGSVKSAPSGVYEFRIQCEDGVLRSWTLNLTPVSGANGAVDGSVAFGAHAAPDMTFELTERELEQTVGALSRGAHCVAVTAQHDPEDPLLRAPPKGGKKGKKAKAKKASSAPRLGSYMVWEQFHAPSRDWKPLPQAMARQLELARENGMTQVTLRVGETSVSVDLGNMMIQQKLKNVRCVSVSGANGASTGTHKSTQCGPVDFGEQVPGAGGSGGKKGKKGKKAGSKGGGGGGGDGAPWYANRVPKCWYNPLTKSKPSIKLMAGPQICATVFEIYVEKIKADALDDKARNSRDELDEFVFEYFLFKYGLYTLAVKHMVLFVSTLLSDEVTASYKCVQLFRDLCSMSAFGIDHNLSRDALDAVLAVYDATVNASHHDPMPACEPTDRWAPLARLRTGLKAALEVGGTAPASCGCALPIERLNPFIVAVCEERRMLMSATSSSELECCSIDTALRATADITKAARDERLQPLKDAFGKSDKDGDGVLTFEEFNEAVQLTMLTTQLGAVKIGSKAITKLFREALSLSKHLGCTNPNALNADAFASTIWDFLRASAVKKSAAGKDGRPSSGSGGRQDFNDYANLE